MKMPAMLTNTRHHSLIAGNAQTISLSRFTIHDKTVSSIRTL
jgi:hypothetical protein